MTENQNGLSVNNLTGVLLQNTYRIIKTLGQGGFGVTYLAEDESVSRLVVIKEYFPSGLVRRKSGAVCPELHSLEFKEDYQKGIRKFLEEARAMSALSSIPETAKVLNYFEENETAYLVMEYIEGITLSRYMQQRELPLSFSEARDLLRPVIEAMEAVHKKGILHRDLNSENILIKEDQSIKIIDFGSAREFSENDRTKTVLVKAGYAPLEQYSRKEKQGPWTDVYSLCATFYEMITGSVPQDSLSRMEKEELFPPSMYGAEISPEEEAILMKGLALDYRERYPDMTGLKEALFPEISEPGDTDLRENGNPRHKKSFFAVIMALCILAAAAGVFVYFRYSSGHSVTYAGNYDRFSDRYEEFTDFLTTHATGQEDTDDGILYTLSPEDARSWGEPCNAVRFSKKTDVLEKYLKDRYTVVTKESKEECSAEVQKYGAILTSFRTITEYTVSADAVEEESAKADGDQATEQSASPDIAFILTVDSDLIDQDILEISLERILGSKCDLSAAAAGLLLELSEYEDKSSEELAQDFQEMEEQKAEKQNNILLSYERPDVTVRFVWKSKEQETAYSLAPQSVWSSVTGSGYYWP